MTNFNFEYKGTFLRYKDSNGNLLDLNGSQVDTDLDERTEQNEIDIAALQQYFDSISVKEDASGAVASFADGADGIPVKSLVVNIEPIQEGTGDPSPENIRLVNGRTAVNIWRDAEHDTTADPTITIQLGQTVYGGTLNVTTGVLTVDMAIVELDSRGTAQSNWRKSASYQGGFFIDASAFGRIYGAYPKTNTPFICSQAKSVNSASEYAVGTCFCDGSINIRIMSADTTVGEWLDYLDDQKTAGTPVEICFKLATSTATITLTPEQLTTLLGTNNIWSDAGNVAVRYVANTKLYIDSAIAASADSAETDIADTNNREEAKETVNEIEKPDIIEEKEVKDDNIEEKEI